MERVFKDCGSFFLCRSHLNSLQELEFLDACLSGSKQFKFLDVCLSGSKQFKFLDACLRGSKLLKLLDACLSRSKLLELLETSLNSSKLLEFCNVCLHGSKLLRGSLWLIEHAADLVFKRYNFFHRCRITFFQELFSAQIDHETLCACINEQTPSQPTETNLYPP